MASDRLRGSTLAAAPQPRLGECRAATVDDAGAVDVSGSVDVAGLVDGPLAEFLAGDIASLDALDPALGGLGRAARDSVLAGGKRLRQSRRDHRPRRRPAGGRRPGGAHRPRRGGDRPAGMMVTFEVREGVSCGR